MERAEHGDSRGRQNGFRFNCDRVPVDHWRRKSISEYFSASSPRDWQVLNFHPNEAARILAFQKKIKRGDTELRGNGSSMV